ncbi:MAG: glutamate racemase [Firmicutes bacterium]|nr:glutamate racemase [Bacillota bacterium]
MPDCRAPVAVFDSGLGGISVLRELVRTLPRENYLYFGDSLHAPYGTKTPQEVITLSLQAADRLLAQGAKALVVACNTATSAAIRTLRKTYPELAIVGTEPAIKPAVERHPGGRILMLATAMTVQKEKFQRLKAQYDDQAQIIPIACSGLMEYVEQGILRGAEVEGYLLDKLEPYLKVPIDAVVLGCTHYPFLRGAIRRIVGRRPEIIDGSIGIARQLERRLEEQGLLNPGDVSGKVEFQNSLDEPEILGLMQALFHYEDEAP